MLHCCGDGPTCMCYSLYILSERICPVSTYCFEHDLYEFKCHNLKPLGGAFMIGMSLSLFTYLPCYKRYSFPLRPWSHVILHDYLGLALSKNANRGSTGVCFQFQKISPHSPKVKMAAYSPCHEGRRKEE